MQGGSGQRADGGIEIARHGQVQEEQRTPLPHGEEGSEFRRAQQARRCIGAGNDNVRGGQMIAPMREFHGASAESGGQGLGAR